MRYKVNGEEVRSENAAKTMKEASKAVVEWILAMPRVNRALDYGCGKLRYSPYLGLQCESLGLVDSAIQLERLQVIDNHLTSVVDYARSKWPGCRLYTVDQFWEGIEERYDFVLCANVLSAIPSRAIRSRSLYAIKSCLHRGGQCLVVNQHANSYFKEARRRPGAVQHLDGWFLPSSKGASYYGILDSEKTARILRAVGLTIVDSWVKGQSTFVLTRR
jgi:hypothetical protein